MEQEKQLTAQSGLSELWAGSKKTRFFMNGKHVPDDPHVSNYQQPTAST
jgi:hypothetical protein